MTAFVAVCFGSAPSSSEGNRGDGSNDASALSRLLEEV